MTFQKVEKNSTEFPYIPHPTPLMSTAYLTIIQ